MFTLKNHGISCFANFVLINQAYYEAKREAARVAKQAKQMEVRSSFGI